MADRTPLHGPAELLAPPADPDEGLSWWFVSLQLMFLVLRVGAMVAVGLVLFLAVFLGLLSVPVILLLVFLAAYFAIERIGAYRRRVRSRAIRAALAEGRGPQA